MSTFDPPPRIADPFTIVLAVWPEAPGDQVEISDEVADGVVALASAVFRRGGRLVVPANPQLLGLVSLVAQPFVTGRPAELADLPQPVVAVETAARSAAAELIAAAFVSRDLVEYRRFGSPKVVEDREPGRGLPDPPASIAARDAPHQPFDLDRLSDGARGWAGTLAVGTEAQLVADQGLTQALADPTVEVMILGGWDEARPDLARRDVRHRLETSADGQPTEQTAPLAEPSFWAEELTDLQRSRDDGDEDRRHRPALIDRGPRGVPWGYVMEMALDRWVRDR